jgi:RNA polymerase sigma-70 factor (ECF subfamily)
VNVLSKPRLIRRDDDLGYLIKALKNTWYSHLRREKTRRAATDEGVEDPDSLSGKPGGSDPQTALEATEVLDALSDLPDPYREAVAAVDVAGLSYAEAAKALGVKQGTVMSRLYRGREQVAQALEA